MLHGGGSVGTLVSTITIDQNVSDPKTRITGDINGPAIQAIRKNSHIYLGKYLGDARMAICQLGDADSNFYHDGSAAVLDGAEGDVFMRLPQFWWKCVELAPNTDIWQISFAYGKKPDGNWKEWDGNDLIGVYKAYYASSKLYSRSGVKYSDTSFNNLTSYAEKRGEGYRLVQLKHHNIMGALFFASYGNPNSRDIFGDIPAYKSSGYYNGLTNALGMNDSTLDATDSMRFWGLENWHGDPNEAVGNVKVKKYVWTVTEDDGSERTSREAASGNGYISKFQFGENLDLIPSELGATATTGYCCYYESAGSMSSITGTTYTVERSYTYSTSSSSSRNKTGIVAVSADRTEGSTSATPGSRLAFRGELVEYDVESFKALEIING